MSATSIQACEISRGKAVPAELVTRTRRMRREWHTMKVMIECYCAGKHDSGGHGLCPECQVLLTYASLRLERCRFGEAKPTCANCPVHCYAGEKREQVKQVMRYAGPRMLWKHPILSLFHWLDGLREAPAH